MAAYNKYFGENAPVLAIKFYFSQWEACTMCYSLENFQVLEEEVGFPSSTKIVVVPVINFLSNFSFKLFSLRE